MRYSFRPRHALFTLLGIMFAAYCFFQARALILGPRITITSPQDGAVVSGSLITLEGRARDAAWISLNGAQIYTDEEGYFSEKLILSPGVSIMTVRVRDRFGREKEKSVSIILN